MISNNCIRFNFDIRPDEYCCGIFNIGSLYFQTAGMFDRIKPVPINKLIELFEEDLIEEVSRLTDEDGNYSNAGYLITATINDKQKEIHEFLLACGWDLVNQFRNSNTDNIVYVFHYYIPYEYISAYRNMTQYDYDDYS